MKIIDLLNKIAKGEKVPYKIKVRDDEFIVYEIAPITDYQDVNQKSNYLFQDYIFSWGSVIFDDEIEIIEEVENKEYEDITLLREEYIEEFENMSGEKQQYIIKTLMEIALKKM